MSIDIIENKVSNHNGFLEVIARLSGKYSEAHGRIVGELTALTLMLALPNNFNDIAVLSFILSGAPMFSIL